MYPISAQFFWKPSGFSRSLKKCFRFLFYFAEWVKRRNSTNRKCLTDLGRQKCTHYSEQSDSRLGRDTRYVVNMLFLPNGFVYEENAISKLFLNLHF